ncbi:hypothetical protein C440309_095 [Synechococcus phage S-CAM4]|uniref:Tail fiber-like protein n=1 Tax=Synechococcus phage S-CAM4 TaxID=1883367 RepID=A0A1D8KKX2_9CAUD|nr:hypothetical protein C440309_095 [Synechococcus phage S-CAM4]
MSFHINSDKEKIRGVNPKLIGDNEVTVRAGTGSGEKEVLRAQLDSETALPRVGINRTGQRVNNIEIDTAGSGFTVNPTVTISSPPPGGVQALASAFIFNGKVVSIAVNNPGSGYLTAPSVSITEGGGDGATATAFLDTVDFELDINGAIRTSTSIISDTARILNLDIDNFITPNAEFRGPNLKTYVNNTGILWDSNVILQKDSYRYFGANVYQALNTGQTGSDAPEHQDGTLLNGEVQLKHIGFRVNDPNEYKYNETGISGVFPRSITPLLGDRSDKIATTEYVLNLATNDVGGRIYVSQQIGSDLNDGRSAVNPVRSIKKAAQLAWATPGVKETLIVSGGDYVEDNPISLPPDCSVVGDNLRLVIIRPANAGKHIFKFGDKNYVTGVTYRDQIDSNGDPVSTWDFAMVFDDKQRIIVDVEANGDFGTTFPIGHQIFGPQQFRVDFQQNTGLSNLQSGLVVKGINTGSRAKIFDVNFTTDIGASAYVNGTIDVSLIGGSFVEGERFEYITSAGSGSAYSLTITEQRGENTLRITTDPTGVIPPGTYVQIIATPSTGSPFTGFYEVSSIDNTLSASSIWDVTFFPILNSATWSGDGVGGTYVINASTPVIETIDTTIIKSIRAEGEVVSVDEDYTTTLPISRLDFSLQGDPSIATGGFQNAQFGNAEDLGGIVVYTSALVGRTNTHEFKEGQEILIEGLPTAGPDLSVLNGKQRIYKVLDDADGRARRFVIPKKIPSITDANLDPGQFAVVRNFSKVVTLSLLNSPNTFPLSTPVERRFQDACNLLRNNREFIADEVVGIINDEFKTDHYSVYNISGTSFDIYLGQTTSEHTYISGGTVTFGGVDYNITAFSYDNTNTGVASITTSVSIPALAEDDIVKLANILISCDAGQKLYPSYSSPDSTGNNGDEQCRQDVVHFINALVRDLEFGSNHNIIEAAQKYIIDDEIAFIEDEIIQNVRAIEYAREIAVYAMRNWRIGNGTPNDTVYAPRYSSLTRYFDNTIITATAGDPACADVKSAIDTLAYLWVDVIAKNQNGTYLDAAYLIARNRDLIADEALSDTETQYPSLGLSDINQRKCRRDIKKVVDALVKDLVLGGNKHIVSAAELYYTGSQLTGIPEAQRPSTIYAFQRVTQYAQDAMRNWTGGDVIDTTPSTATYNPVSGQVVVTIPSPAVALTTGDRIAFSEEALTFSCNYSGTPGDHPSPLRFDSNYGQSYAITNVSTNGGNTLITCTVPDAGAASGSTHTFVSAKTNGTILIYDSVTLSSPIPKFEDWNILLYGSQPLCSNVASSIITEMSLLEDILDGSILPGATTKTNGTVFNTSQILSYPDNYIYDSSNQRLSIRGDYDDYPIIEASPYTQNASVISFLGGGGAEVDGDKVKQPNCPFPGLELDGSASFPNQGKSMVAAAFTIVSFGGTGYKVINDGYTQLVSVFVIFCTDGVLAESGGYCSITNSATNFGQFALRGTGFRKDPYEFDIATVSNVSATPTGRTILTVSGLGREPLEHYVVKIDGYENTNPNIEYFIDVVAGVTVGPPFSAQLTIDDGTGGAMDLTDKSTGNPVATSALLGQTINLHRPSIVNSSSHTWEFAGSGTNYLALPENGGTKIEANEQVSEDYGRVYCSGTDELGDFKVGTFANIENRTGAITFTGTVTISEVEFLKLKGGDVVVTGFDASNTLGGAQATDSKLPTQKAVRDYITNSLGPYINKPYSTNAVPRALVELTDSGKISIDQIPALRPFQVYTVADQAERTSIEGALAGDIAIQQDTSTSFILNNDNDSLFLGFAPDQALAFTIGDVFTGSVTTGSIQSTEYRKGVVYTINVSDGGSGYTTAPTITFSGGNPEAGAVSAVATCTIANGSVVTVTIESFGGVTGGKGYTTQPTVTFSAPVGAGTQAQGNALLESRLYGSIVNNIKIEDTDTFEDSTTPTANTINISRVVNTSSFNVNNWVSLSSNQIAASDITSGVIETDRLASGGAANSFTFLRGDQNFALAVQSLKGAEKRYFAKLAAQCSSGSSQMIFTTNSDVLIGHEVKNTVSGIQNNTNINGVITAAGLTTISLNNPVNATIPLGSIIEFERGDSPLTFESTYTQGGFIDDVIIGNPGSGYTNGQYFDLSLTGGSGTGLKVNVVVSGNEVTEITVTDGGVGYNSDFTVTSSPTAIGSGSALILQAKTSTVNRQYANVSIDTKRVSDLTISADLYGTIGVSRYKKSQFTIGQAGNGSVELKTGADSGLDADLLDGAQGSFYTNAGNLSSGTLPTDRLAGSYNISISNQSGSTIKLITGTNNPSSSPTPNFFSTGIVSNTIFNSANGLNDGGTRNMTLTFRQGGSGFDTGFGGVRQLAFTDNDNMWLRGSGTGVTAFGSWGKVWTSLNDGLDSGLDADRLDNKQGSWYQNALNINSGTLSTERMPLFIEATRVRDSVTVKSFFGDPKYKIYFSGKILDTSPSGDFTPGNPINLYNSNAQGVGSFTIDNVATNDDTADNFNDYTILIGRLTSGNFVGAITAGTASNRVVFDDFSIEDGNTVDIGKIESDGGTALLKLGRVDGQASTPAIYFRSSQVVPSSNTDDHKTVSLTASGGNATANSGSLNAGVVNADGFTINGQKIWNEGNVIFRSVNVVSSAVIRDANGDFAAGTITASITGASSLNVLKTGDTMTGTLAITGAGSNLSVSGNASITGTTSLTNDLAVDTDTLFVDVSTDRVGINAGVNPLSNLDVRGDDGLYVRTLTNGVGAKIRFNDQSTTFSQVGTLRYNHSDTNSPNSEYGEGFTMEGTEAELFFRVVGDVIASRKMGVNINREPDYTLEVNGDAMFQTGVTIDTDNDNSGAPLVFRGSSSYRNFRVGNQLVGNHLFTIQASTNNGGTTWNGTPAITIAGDTNRVAINTTSTSGIDPSNNQTRNYNLNIQGDVNFNGTLYQNNAEFVTSRWTESPNGNDIYRPSKVGINFTSAANPGYELEVKGSINIEGSSFTNNVNEFTLRANGDRQWIDSYGVMKANRNTISEDITIPTNTNCGSFGPLEITNGTTITISNGAAWSIL